MELDNRLKTIYEMMDAGCVPMDVGTDHCKLPLYALQRGKISRAYAGDVREGPLAAARRSVERYGMEDRVVLLLSDGLSALTDDDRRAVDTVVMAGMGGLLIRDLIENAPFVKTEKKTLLLQPMTAVYELKDYLRGAGFVTEKERIACEGDKLYIIIRAVFTGTVGTDDDPFRHLTEDPLFARYLAAQKRRFQIQKNGLLSADERDGARLADVEKRLKQIERYGDRI